MTSDHATLLTLQIGRHTASTSNLPVAYIYCAVQPISSVGRSRSRSCSSGSQFYFSEYFLKSIYARRCLSNRFYCFDLEAERTVKLILDNEVIVSHNRTESESRRLYELLWYGKHVFKVFPNMLWASASNPESTFSQPVIEVSFHLQTKLHSACIRESASLTCKASVTAQISHCKQHVKHLPYLSPLEPQNFLFSVTLKNELKNGENIVDRTA